MGFMSIQHKEPVNLPVQTDPTQFNHCINASYALRVTVRHVVRLLCALPARQDFIYWILPVWQAVLSQPIQHTLKMILLGSANYAHFLAYSVRKHQTI